MRASLQFSDLTRYILRRLVIMIPVAFLASASKNVQNYPNTYNGWFGGRDIFKTRVAKQ